jgi:O-antigen ligase
LAFLFLVPAALVLPWLIRTSIVRPRLLTYLVFALVPTQVVFVPVSDFFVSPADVVVVLALTGLAVRLTAGRRESWVAVWQHRYLLLLVLAYVVGFLVLDHSSRTLVRVPLAIVPSVLACETLRERRHIMIAAAALVVAALIDAGYGLFWYLQGIYLHPSRFAGLQGPNFSAMVILTGAAILLAKRARTPIPPPLVAPGALIGLSLATLSQMGIVALAGAWAVLRRVITWRNTLTLAAAAVLFLTIALSFEEVRERVAARTRPEAQMDGVERTSAGIRVLLLGIAWRAFADSPIVGLGYGAFEPYSRLDPEMNALTGGSGYGTHNMYVEILVEGGLLAFAFFVLHFGQYARPLAGALRSIRRRKDQVAATALVGFPIVLISAALMNVLMFYLFWAVCGLTLAFLNLWRRETLRDQTTALTATERARPASISSAVPYQL